MSGRFKVALLSAVIVGKSLARRFTSGSRPAFSSAAAAQPFFILSYSMRGLRWVSVLCCPFKNKVAALLSCLLLYNLVYVRSPPPKAMGVLTWLVTSSTCNHRGEVICIPVLKKKKIHEFGCAHRFLGPADIWGSVRWRRCFAEPQQAPPTNESGGTDQNKWDPC